MNKYRLKILYFVVMSIFIGGCNSTLHKDYSYDDAHSKFSNGMVVGRLLGTMKEIDSNNSVNSSPYELVVVVERNAIVPSKCSAIVEDLKIVGGGSSHMLVDKGFDTVSSIEGDGNPWVSFLYEKVELEYVDYNVEFRLSLAGECIADVNAEFIQLTFNKKYSERKIGFWDALMGI